VTARVVGVVKWIVISAFVLGVIVLIASVAAVLRRLSGLRAAIRRARRRQAEATALQHSVESLTETLAGVQERAGTAQQRLAAIQAGRGG
jgi:biopolymer transport protein ExbB/TolQ